MAVFGKEGAAAVTPNTSCQCCSLAYCPPNTTYSSCISVSHYMWECTASGGFLYCWCCEKKRSDGSYYASALQCQYP